MKVDFAICLVAALGLHAGVLLLKLPAQPGAAASEIEIGLEAPGDAPGDTTTQTTPSEVPAPPVPQPPEPETTPPVETPPPTPMPEPPVPEKNVSPEPIEEKSAEAPPAAQPPASPTPPSQPAKPTKASRPGAARPASAGTRAAQKGAAGGAGSASSSARYLFRAPLRYPADALQAKMGGTVILGLDINENGRATNAHVQQSSGRADMDTAAIDCAMNSRYEPYRINGLPQPCRVQAPFQFRAR